MRMLLEPGTLWERVVRQSRRSLSSGDREPLATELHEIEDDGVLFTVRVAVGRDRKWSTTLEQRSAGVDPFMPPYDDELFVAEVSDTHVAILNKFNAIDPHLLLVTRRFESQSNALGDADFASLSACMNEFDALAFYNSSPEAGASQEHKHLQLVSLSSLAAVGSAVDIPFRGASTREAPSTAASGYAFASTDVPSDLGETPLAAGVKLAGLYRGLLEELDLLQAGKPTSPYNLLLTHERMVIVPRTHAGWQRTGVNAMGFAGSFLVHDLEGLERLRKAGPLEVLAHSGRRVGVELDAPSRGGGES